MPTARVIAFYLPQYHPIPANNERWGPGFTEWTNVTKARPLFKGHEQPRLPGDLGFYDLRVAEIREQQANLAREAGIEGFCYWHYWFGNGQRALERIFSEVVEQGVPNYPFCLGWANESWTGRWHGLDSQIIFEQTYPGITDYERHFDALLPAFKDHRYIEVEGKKLFIIYRPDSIPAIDEFLSFWNARARLHGFNGFFFLCANTNYNYRRHAELSGAIPRDIHETMAQLQGNKFARWRCRFDRIQNLIWPKYCPRPLRCSYSDFVEKWINRSLDEDVFPCVIPNWDNTPRCGNRGMVLTAQTPQLFKKMLEAEIAKVMNRPFQRRLVFIKSWNEWAEGNYLEPDRRFGRQYLDVLREILYRTAEKTNG